MQGSRPARIAEQVRQELAQMLARDVHDPAIGLLTVTRVQVSPDLQVARVYYTQMGDDRARRETVKALGRATPFLRRQLGARLRLRRVPELHFHFDEGIARQARIEEILLDLEAERKERAAEAVERDVDGRGDRAPVPDADSGQPDAPAPADDERPAEPGGRRRGGRS
jgi:ribosome-binding factor A